MIGWAPIVGMVYLLQSIIRNTENGSNNAMIRYCTTELLNNGHFISDFYPF